MTKRILTGAKPTAGTLHIGNYFGAFKPMIDFQEKGEEIFIFVPDMHALTTIHDGSIAQSTVQFLKQYIAIGLEGKNTHYYLQSDIVGHAQLNRVLTSITTMGFMERMHAFKDAVAKGKQGDTTVGTFCYPILQAADILLYDANYVPVGQDQKQHVEFARDIGEKFNRLFGETFVIPEAYIDPYVAVIPGLDGRKMSKSYNNFLGLMDDEKTLQKKIKIIATDMKSVEESKDPDTCNVYNIIKHFLNNDEKLVLRDRYIQGGLSYKEVKDYLFEKISSFLLPIQSKYNQITDSEIKKLLKDGAIFANSISEKKIQDVYKKVGFGI